MSNKDTLCILPWMHFSLKPNGTVKPCCRFIMHDNQQGKFVDFENMKLNDFENVSDILASEKFNEIRKSMLAGEKLTGCAKCYKEEKVTNASMRTGYNGDYDVINTVALNRPSIKFLEVTFGNYCNLACRTCNSQLSTAWHDDDKVLTKHYSDREVFAQRQNIGFHWKSEDFKDTVHIKFTGGEPMLHPDFIKFLEVIIAGGYHKQIKLEIFTNSSWTPKDKLISTLIKFKKVEIWMSVDGTGEVNDYVRQNSTWSAVEESMQTWLDAEKEYKNVSVTLTPTLCAYNIFNMQTLLEYWIDTRATKGLETIHDKIGKVVMNMVYSPTYIALDVLPNKLLLIEKLTKYLERIEIDRPYIEYKIISRQLNKIIQYLSKPSTIDNTETFLKYTKDVDVLRNQSLQNQIPELYIHLQENLGYNYDDVKGHIE